MHRVTTSPVITCQECLWSSGPVSDAYELCILMDRHPQETGHTGYTLDYQEKRETA